MNTDKTGEEVQGASASVMLETEAHPQATATASILSASVPIPHALTSISSLSDSGYYLLALLLAAKQGYAPDDEAWSAPVIDEDGYFAGPGTVRLARWLGKRDRKSVQPILGHLRSLHLIATRKQRVLQGCDEICLLALAAVGQVEAEGGGIVLDGGQAGESRIPYPMLADHHLPPISLRIYAGLLQLSQGAGGLAFASVQTIAQRLGRRPASIVEGRQMLVRRGYMAMLQRGLRETNICIFPRPEDVGNSAWSEGLSRVGFYRLVELGLITVLPSGKVTADTEALSYRGLIARGLLKAVAGYRSEGKGYEFQDGENNAIQGGENNAIQGGEESASQDGDVSRSWVAGENSVIQDGENSAIQAGENYETQDGEESASQGGNVYNAPAAGENSVIQGEMGNAIQDGEDCVIQDGNNSETHDEVAQDGKESVIQDGLNTVDRVDSDSDSDYIISESESDTKAASAHAQGPMGRAYAVVRQLSREYGDNPDSNRTQLYQVWSRYEREMGTRLSASLFLQLVEEAAAYVHTLAAASVKSSRLAAFFAALQDKLAHEAAGKSYRRKPAAGQGWRTNLASAYRPGDALPAQSRVHPPAAMPVPSSQVTMRMARPASPPPPTVPAELRPSSEDQAMWQLAVAASVEQLPVAVASYFRQAQLAAVGGDQAAGCDVYILWLPESSVRQGYVHSYAQILADELSQAREFPTALKFVTGGVRC